MVRHCITAPWKCRNRGKRGTVRPSHTYHRCLEDAGVAGVSHIPTALGGWVIQLRIAQA